MVSNGHLHYFEDSDDSMSRTLKPGAVDAETERRFEGLMGNPYLKIIHEDDLKAGHHPELVSVLDLGETEPESTFDLTFDGKKHLLEVYGGCTVLDGKKLSDDETKALMLEISSGKKLLEPRG